MDDTERRWLLRATLAGAGLTVAGTAATSDSDCHESNQNNYESNQETTQNRISDALETPTPGG